MDFNLREPLVLQWIHHAVELILREEQTPNEETENVKTLLYRRRGPWEYIML